MKVESGREGVGLRETSKLVHRGDKRRGLRRTIANIKNRPNKD